MNTPRWLYSLPPGWRALRLRHVASVSNSSVDKKSEDGGHPVRLCNYTDVYYNDFISNEMDLMTATATASEIRRFRLQAGDVAITKDSEAWDDIAIPACVRGDLDNVVCGYHLTLLRPRPERLTGRYLLRVLQAQGVREQFWVAANGVTRFGLGQLGIKDALLPVPPLSVQLDIADFLDRKTAAIDALIDKKQKLLDLLAEKRTALINHAVTKGLNPGAPIKESGIPWIGEIPAHWEVIRFRRIIDRMDQGWSPIAEDRPIGHGEWGVFKLSAVSNGRLRAQEHKALPAGTAPKPELQVAPGDLLVTRANTPAYVGDACVVHRNAPRLMLSDLIYRLRLDPTVDPRFICFFLLSASGRAPIASDARGSSQSMVKISQSHIKAWLLPIPPLKEQSAIVEHLDSELRAVSRATAAIRKQTEVLQEYRQALITAAVTGQLDVTHEAAA